MTNPSETTHDRPDPHLREPSYYDDLDGSLAQAWTLLSRGIADRRSAFRTPALATIGPNGEPEVRTVVMRAASNGDWNLRFHTDRRSAKFLSLTKDPRVALHFYDARAKIQLRVAGHATLHTGNEIARAAWVNAFAMSRVCYAQVARPGTPIASPYEGAIASADEDNSAIENFVVISVQITRIEWLYLAAKGHRRALFERNDLGQISSTWLAP